MSESGASRFPTTRWTLVARAHDVSPQVRRQALADLLQLYVGPIRFYLMVTRGISADRADDLIQGFVASQVLERDLLARVEREKGKFRSFLVVALDRYTINAVRDERAQWRGGGQVGSLPANVEPPSVPAADPVVAFDIAWARHVLERALRAMRAECQRIQRPEYWGVFEDRILSPILDGREPIPYSQLVQRFSFTSPAQAANALMTSKRMFIRELRAIVGEYEADPARVEEEIADLHHALSQGRRGHSHHG